MSRNAEGSHTSKQAQTKDRELELSKINMKDNIDPEKRVKPELFTAFLDNEVVKEEVIIAAFDKEHIEAFNFFKSD